MRIAILMTNTDESDFAHRWPMDGEKFPAMMRRVRPGWEFVVYPVKDGVFPETLARVDGVMITGSPASVNSGADWVARLEALVREIIAAGIPLFGACFGHQVIATALGGTVGANPGGWVFGQVEVTFTDGRTMPIYASHSEQVLQLPEGAEVIATGPGCPIAGFVVGDGVMTTQYHPEMEPEFVAALIEELADELGPEITARAHASLGTSPDMAETAEWIARFLEHKQSDIA
ncbi:type 1 glutamine amidotransferase [Aquicoccus porphyridii]|uniref:Type 1 glutamine amidotransferase n=1 Tax=Aquicoccus porphyridii TaxID=1852029 RepID=A0A5A9ZUY0_9RHOB|nr:type 1 glutamine amidotransferase [Aquicoccus porphyridii]KAA0921144.1 type 1 glutamine amidotransferase [Aquicoccus porphyridii]RAI56321.1 type 1 glutamine amidotransferase [Rhodobacteraceae bacterium AsT-22]